MRVTVADLARREDGIAVIIVTLSSFVILALVALVLTSGQGAQTSSARDRNFDIALGVAESGVHEAIARINSSGGTYTGSINGSTSAGGYDGTVTRSGSTFTIEVVGSTGGENFGRERRVRVTMQPPDSFPFALFSETAIEVKNNGQVEGGVWANDSVTIQLNDIIDGSVTAAQSFLLMEGGALIKGNAWTGGTNAGQYAIRMLNGAKINGWAKASVSAPSDPTTCGGADQNAYKVETNSGVVIGGDLTTWGEKTGPGTVNGVYTQRVCTEAPAAIPIPPFSWNPDNYADEQEFSSVAAFQSYLTTNGSALSGHFYITDPSPSQTNRINLSGVSLAGDTTIVTTAPVFTNGLDDDGVTGEAVFVLASHYTPPLASACNVNDDASECAIHVKNNFQADCRTAVLIYADNGPVAVKNNQEMCGTVAAESILVKNNQIVTYDSRVERIIGFGSVTYEVSRWEELPA